MVLTAAMIHEGGHLLALKLLGVRDCKFRLSSFGAVLRTEDLRLSYLQEIFAVLAGPAANLICGAALTSASSAVPAAAAPAGAHWSLGIFNLLPAAPLDGWRVLQLFLCWVLGPERGECAAGIIGAAAALLLSGGILFLIFFSGGNLWLLPMAIWLSVTGVRSVTE